MLFNKIDLILSLTKREISSKYKGSLLGPLWSVITPLLLLTVYSFVFGVIFQSKWPSFNNSRADFAIVLFIGMLTFNIFSDSVSKSPWTITSNANFVKKIIFPIEILAIVNVFSSIFNFMMGLIAWLFIMIIFHGLPPITIFLLPIYILPLLILSAGVSWIFSSLGVYFKDIGQFMGVLIMLLMFSSPVFYSIDSIPLSYKIFFELNPIASSINMVRDVALFGVVPSLKLYLLTLFVSSLISYAGYIFFKKTKVGFSDVL